MENVLRTLAFGGQVSLTVADTTKIVQKAIQLHKLSPASARLFGRALSAMTFASACLKGDKGEVSLAIKTDGACGDIAVSGNGKLHMRGYIDPTQLRSEQEHDPWGENGSLTIIRNDGYSRPFVGSCAIPRSATVDETFETYYTMSEQLPTRIATTVAINEKGGCAYAAVAALQPLPFADETALRKTRETSLETLLSAIGEQGLERGVQAYFTPDRSVWDVRTASYRCNCSRPYLKKVLVSLGEAQMRQIIAEDGALSVHCHYCNKDYSFTEKDADALFGVRETK